MNRYRLVKVLVLLNDSHCGTNILYFLINTITSPHVKNMLGTYMQSYVATDNFSIEYLFEIFVLNNGRKF